MPNIGTESQFEETTIDRLKALGYRYEYGGHVDRPNKQAALPSPAAGGDPAGRYVSCGST